MMAITSVQKNQKNLYISRDEVHFTINTKVISNLKHYSGMMAITFKKHETHIAI